MRRRLIMILVAAALVTGVLLLRTGQSPENDTHQAGEQSQVNLQVNPGLPSGSDIPGASDQSSTIGPATETEQAHNSPSSEALSSPTQKPDDLQPGVSHLPGDKSSANALIGGTVEDEAGYAQPGFEVLAERMIRMEDRHTRDDLASKGAQSTFADLNGNFLFDRLEDGEYRLSLAPVDGLPPSRTRVRTGTLNARLVVVEPRDIRVYGTVTSTGGAPVEDVDVTAAPRDRSATSGEHGEYELDVSWLGSDVVYTVLFQKNGYRQQKTRISPADLDSETGEYRLDVSMEPVDKLTLVAGQLTDTRGTPLGGETIHLLTPGMRTWHQTQTDSDGYYLFEEVEPGEDHRMQIRPASGYKNKNISPLIVPAEGLSLDIMLEPLDEGELSGWMVDLDGQPVPGFSITLRSNSATSRSVSVVSDREGFFSVEEFPVGDALFLTQSDPELVVQGIRVSAQPRAPVMVILDSGRHVQRGRVVDAFGVPVSQSDITLDWTFKDKGLQSSSKRRTKTDQDGQFLFTGLGPDLHTLEVSAAGFEPTTRTINVGAGPAEVMIELQESNQ